jgi:hypothetical protein
MMLRAAPLPPQSLSTEIYEAAKDASGSLDQGELRGYVRCQARDYTLIARELHREGYLWSCRAVQKCFLHPTLSGVVK